MSVRREFSVEDWIGIYRRKAWLIALAAVACAAAGFLISFAMPNKYTSQTRILVESPIVPGEYVKPVVSDDVNRQLASMQGEILSRTHLQQLIEKYHLFPGQVNRVPMEALVQQLQKAITVAPLSPTPGTMTQDVLGFNIDVTLSSAQLAQEVCTDIAAMYKDQNSQHRQQQSEDTTQFLAKQLDDAKARLDAQDAKLAAFQDKYLGAQPEDQQTNLTLLAGLTQQLQAVTQSESESQENVAFNESMLNQQLSAQKSVTDGRDPQNLQQQLNDLESQLVTTRARYTDKHPAVLTIQDEIADLEKKIKAAGSGNQAPVNLAQQSPSPTDSVQLQTLRAQLHQAQLSVEEKKKEQAALQQQIRSVQGRIQLSPMVQEQYKSLTRDYQTALDFYNSNLKKRDEAQMATDLERRQQGQNFRVLDPPNLPQAPSLPDRRIFALGGLALGLALGAGFVRFSAMRDKSLHNSRDVETFLGVPAIAVIGTAGSNVGDLAPAPFMRFITPSPRSGSER